MSEQHTATALRLINDMHARDTRLGTVTANDPTLGLNGYGNATDAPAAWPPDQLRRALLYLAVCEPRKRASEDSYTLKHRAEELTGGYICNGALITAALMCNLPVRPQPPNAKIALKAPPLANDGHLLACQASRCEGACLLTNSLTAIRAWHYPSLQELVGRAGFLWYDLPAHIQDHLHHDYASGARLHVAEEVASIRQALEQHASQAHHAWGWCDPCHDHHIEPCDQEPLGYLT